jgi:hypothetical protein
MGGATLVSGIAAAVVSAVATTVSATRIERTAKLISWPAGTNQAVELASLRSAVQSGNMIYANDLNRIATLINNMNGHYHTYDDAYQLATYGNTGDRTDYYEGKFTAGPDQVFAAPTDTAANTSITASRHNELKDSINAVRQHYHQIDDRTG